MKRTLITIALMVMSLLAINAQEKPNAIVFEMKDGAKVSYLFEDLPAISFTGGDIVVMTHLMETAYPQSDVQRYVFTYQDISAVVSPKVEGFHHFGNQVSIDNIKAGTPVCVYSADGKTMQTATANSSGKATISLEALPAGIYVVKYLSTSVKITKQ